MSLVRHSESDIPLGKDSGADREEAVEPILNAVAGEEENRRRWDLKGAAAEELALVALIVCKWPDEMAAIQATIAPVPRSVLRLSVSVLISGMDRWLERVKAISWESSEIGAFQLMDYERQVKVSCAHELTLMTDTVCVTFASTTVRQKNQ